MGRTRVAVFQNDAASGATIGYYGILLGGQGRRLASYSVYVPALDKVLMVARSEMLVVGSDESAPLSEAEINWFENQKLRIEFDLPLDSDNSEVIGVYRVGSRLIGKFHFIKRNQPLPTYRLTVPTEGKMGRADLCYFVPADRVLNREAVMSALSEVLCVEPPDPDQTDA